MQTVDCKVLFYIFDDFWCFRGQIDGRACKEVSSLIADNSCMAQVEDPGDLFNRALGEVILPVSIEIVFIIFWRALIDSMKMTARQWYLL